MAAKWVTVLKGKLAACPLRFQPDGTVKCDTCAHGEGKKVPLYRVTNYGTTYSVCCQCGKRYT